MSRLARTTGILYQKPVEISFQDMLKKKKPRRSGTPLPTPERGPGPGPRTPSNAGRRYQEPRKPLAGKQKPRRSANFNGAIGDNGVVPSWNTRKFQSLRSVTQADSTKEKPRRSGARYGNERWMNPPPRCCPPSTLSLLGRTNGACIMGSVSR